MDTETAKGLDKKRVMRVVLVVLLFASVFARYSDDFDETQEANYREAIVIGR